MKVKDVRFLKLGLTNRCNSHCRTCWHSNKTRLPAIVELDTKIYEHIREKIYPNLKILDLLSGGELFTYPHIGMVLDDIKRYKFKTTLETNFSVLTDKHREALKATKTRFVVSMDGSKKELQEFLRPQCYYDKVIDNIKFFVKNGNKVVIRMTVSNYNFYDMINMLRLAEKLGVDGVICHGVQKLDSLEQPLNFDCPPEDMEYIEKVVSGKYKVQYDLFLDYFRRSSTMGHPMRNFYCVMDPLVALKAGLRVKLDCAWARFRHKPACPISRRFIKVDIDGKIYFCSCHECKALGSLRENTLGEILDNDMWDEKRRVCTCELTERTLHAPR